MNVTLSRAQQQWLESQVAAGQFKSLDDAVAVAVADLMTIRYDDLSWAKSYVDAARAAVEQGQVVSVEEALADIEAHMATLKR